MILALITLPAAAKAVTSSASLVWKSKLPTKTFVLTILLDDEFLVGGFIDDGA